MPSPPASVVWGCRVIDTLASRWREEAALLKRRHAEQAARVLLDCADELEAEIRDAADEPLDIATASKESGYSADRLRHLLADHQIPNAGRSGAPRIRRRDLPRKAAGARQAGGFDAAAVAREIVAARGNGAQQ